MQLLIPVSEAETVVCFCFQTAPDSGLPTAEPEGDLREAWRLQTSPHHTHTTRRTHGTHTRRDPGHPLLYTLVQDPTPLN